MSASGNRTGEQYQEVCRNGYQITINHIDADPNQKGKTAISVLGAKNQLTHTKPCRHPTYVQCTLHFRTAANRNSCNSGPVNGIINSYGGVHGYTLHV